MIEAHVDASDEVDISDLEAKLRTLPLDEIVAFDEIFTRLHRRSYTWPLWGAAYVINGGRSDDGFADFRGWLIAQGRAVYEKALDDPDSLADTTASVASCEEIQYAAASAYEAASGGIEMPIPSSRHPELGPGWDFNDKAEMQRRYPRLFAQSGT